MCVCVCMCAPAMCLPSVMSYNLGTVFIPQTCSSTHTALLVRRSGMNHPCHPPGSLLTSSCEPCVSVCECVCLKMQQLEIYLLIRSECPPCLRSNKVIFRLFLCYTLSPQNLKVRYVRISVQSVQK